MKKILTFLVMLFVTVSVAVGQTGNNTTSGTADNPGQDVTPTISNEQETPVYFNYQAVVRDMTDHHALYHDKDNLQVNIKIYDAPDQQIPRYSETHTDVKTNHNGMVTLLVGKGTPADDAVATLYDVDWSNAFIESEFIVEGKTISMVQTQITAVPLALQAEGPMHLTTQQIVNYILNGQPGTFLTNGEDVEAIIFALNQNSELKEYIKERLMNYLKNHKEEAKDLVLYYLQLVDPEDLTLAESKLKDETKDAIVDMLVDFAESESGKAAAKRILINYISTTSLDDIQDVYDAIVENENYNDIKNWAIDKVMDYLKSDEGKDSIQKLVKYYVDNASEEDVKNLHTYLKTNEDVWSYFITKFNQYLENYLTTHYYLQNCEDNPLKTGDGANAQIATDICPLLERLETLENSVNTPECSNGFAETNAVVVSQDQADHTKYTITVTLKNKLATGESLKVVVGEEELSNNYGPQAGTAENVYIYNLDGFNPDGISGKVYFNGSESSCNDSKEF